MNNQAYADVLIFMTSKKLHWFPYTDGGLRGKFLNFNDVYILHQTFFNQQSKDNLFFCDMGSLKGKLKETFFGLV